MPLAATPVGDERAIRVAKLLTERYESAYADKLETWRDLERKAQIFLAIAGVLLAGLCNLARDVQTEFSLAERICIGAIAVSVALAVIRCVRALRVRLHAAPPVELSTKIVMSAFLGEQRTDPDLVAACTAELARVWRSTFESLDKAIVEKGEALRGIEAPIGAVVVLFAVVCILHVALV